MNTKFIAEVGSNHNQDINRCFRFIETAKELGCWGIKFQLFFADKLWTKPETIAKMSHWQLPTTFIPSISKYCKDVDIQFGCSVFDRDSIPWLDLYIDFFKIGSYEILCEDMIKDCYNTDKPLFISTGLILPKNILAMLNNINWNPRKRRTKIIILYCNSNYPAESANCNMINIHVLKHTLSEDIGWSDHSKEPGVIYQAVANGADVIEFHLDLDGQGNEYPVGHCWLTEEIKNVIETIKVMEQSQENFNYKPDPKLLAMRTNPITMKRDY